MAIAAALVLATPLAVWGLVGDLSETRFDDLDYLLKVPQPPRALELVAGAVALATMVASVVALVGAGVGRRWSATVVLLCVAGALLAYSGRVITAGVIGANIGAGLVMFFVVPTALLLVVAAGANAAVERRR